ncbi:amino acid ABC transporter permease [Altericista sp. CCNU0014]|uniref:amino acid ABC transporter permease n=1 Tax=Altericista sp. CCNU0014 TaxID=3082949 RepID=UPI00384F5D56
MQNWQSLIKTAFSPPSLQVARIWIRQNLLSTWYNALLTLLCLWAVAATLKSLGTWIFTQAQWEVVAVNLRLIFVGRYPVEQLWRLWLVLMLLVAVPTFSWGAIQGWGRKQTLIATGVGLGTIGALVLGKQGFEPIAWIALIAGVSIGAGSLGAWSQRSGRGKILKAWLPLLWFVNFCAMLWLISGGLGLTAVSTTFWNGLLLTLLVAMASIVLSFPLGVLLALGRQSQLPVIRWVSTGYIELIRGLPLIGILFMAQVMLPLLLPPQISVDQLVRAIAGLSLFSAAYLAETVRGGLQSIPNGQWEASRALGLSTPLTLGLIVLPQALRTVVPAIVGQFISLFKDTALLSIVGLVELTGIARSITSQAEYLGRYAEVYLAIGLMYWLFCYSLSLASRRLELPSGS